MYRNQLTVSKHVFGGAAASVSQRATRAIVDLDAIAGNVAIFRNLIAPATKLLAVVKANGYGHGAVMIAGTALAAGADQLAVATVDEGAELRAAQIHAPILVLGPASHSEIARALRLGLQLSVATLASINAISDEADCAGALRPAELHLKIDTGMRRYGCMPENALALARRIAEDRRLKFTGLFTHFASADEENEQRTLEQVDVFEATVDTIRTSGIDVGIRHVANSAATLRSRRYDYDLVRVGISLYGIAPSSETTLASGLRPAMSIRSELGRVFELAPGDRVSYGGTYVARNRERAALVPIGYADGYRRGFSGKAWMAIDGVQCPILGRVCMDQTIIGLPAEVQAHEGNEVIIAGTGTAPSLDELANVVGTIPYEIAASIARRVPRYFVERGDLVAVEDLDGLHQLR
ncbi:MAG: alanine racemase [Thermomicrobiales bacterium]